MCSYFRSWYSSYWMWLKMWFITTLGNSTMGLMMGLVGTWPVITSQIHPMMTGCESLSSCLCLQFYKDYLLRISVCVDCIHCVGLKPLDNPQLFSEFESLGVHGASLQIACQARQNHVITVVSLVIVHTIQCPLSRRHHILVNELAAFTTISTAHFTYQQQFNDCI